MTYEGDFLDQIIIRPAVPEDAGAVYRIMYQAQAAMADPTAYITDTLEYITHHISRDGFCLVAEADGTPVGFFLVCVPGLEENNLGYYLNYSREQLMKTAMMDSAAVLPEYQGKGIMGRMFRMATEIAEQDYPYLLGTVHPDNTPSRRNFEKCGYTSQMTLEKPGGLVRLLMGKFREIPG